MEPAGSAGVRPRCDGVQRRSRQRRVPRLPAPPPQRVPEAGLSRQDRRQTKRGPDISGQGGAKQTGRRGEDGKTQEEAGKVEAEEAAGEEGKDGGEKG